MPKIKTCATSGCEEQTALRYCDSHRCQTDGCKHKRQGTSKRCSRHNLCKKKDCTEPILQTEDGISHGIFCEDHHWACRKLDCFNDTSETSQSPGSYCADHTCLSSGCQIPLIGEDGGSPFCRDHRCLVEGCTGGGAYRPQGYRYCYTHGCDVEGCKKTVTKDENATKCSDHACKAPACVSAREDGRKYCGDHASCGKDNCKSLKHPTARFCEGHLATCIKPDCFAERNWTGHWEYYLYKAHFIRSDEYRSYWVKDSPLECCTNHTCRADECTVPSQFEQNRRYCEAHYECSKKNCTTCRFVTQRFCSTHAGLCDRDDCFQSRAGDLGSLCSKHGCLAPSCGMPRREHEMYCAGHIICGSPDCAVVCELPEMACEDHRCKCHDYGCYKAVCSSETDYCKDHVCSHESCHEARQSDFDSSVSHTLCMHHYEAYRSAKMRKKTKHGKAKHSSKTAHSHKHKHDGPSTATTLAAQAAIEVPAQAYVVEPDAQGGTLDYACAPRADAADTDTAAQVHSEPNTQGEYGAGEDYTYIGTLEDPATTSLAVGAEDVNSKGGYHIPRYTFDGHVGLKETQYEAAYDVVEYEAEYDPDFAQQYSHDAQVGDAWADTRDDPLGTGAFQEMTTALKEEPTVAEAKEVVTT